MGAEVGREVLVGGLARGWTPAGKGLLKVEVAGSWATVLVGSGGAEGAGAGAEAEGRGLGAGGESCSLAFTRWCWP